MDPDVIAPNLKRRLSGVTASVVRLVPIMAGQISITTTGPGLPAGLPHMPLWRMAVLSRKRWRVWHARRNTEMLLGLILRNILRRKLRLVFTSASQRGHSSYTKWLIARMDCIVATSARTARYLDRPAQVIMHGIDTSTFAPTTDRPALRARLGVPDAMLVGCYGRIRKQKGTDVFVTSLLQIMKTNADVVALIMGRATKQHVEFLNGLKQQIAVAGLTNRFLFLPEVAVDQMPDWYRILDLYVAPQRWEGFGLTPLEAMACAVPVIATRVGAFEEIVQQDVTGALVDPNDRVAMSNSIKDLINDNAKRAAQSIAARQRLEASFRIQGEADALIALYRRLLQQP